MIRLINIDNIDLYTWEFQYQLRRKMMTKDESKEQLLFEYA